MSCRLHKPQCDLDPSWEEEDLTKATLRTINLLYSATVGARAAARAAAEAKAAANAAARAQAAAKAAARAAAIAAAEKNKQPPPVYSDDESDTEEEQDDGGEERNKALGVAPKEYMLTGPGFCYAFPLLKLGKSFHHQCGLAS